MNLITFHTVYVVVVISRNNRKIFSGKTVFRLINLSSCSSDPMLVFIIMYKLRLAFILSRDVEIEKNIINFHHLLNYTWRTASRNTNTSW